MPKKDEIQEEADPIIVAALLEDGSEDEEDEQAKKEALEQADEDALADEEQADPKDDDEGEEKPKKSGKKDDEEDAPSEDDDAGKGKPDEDLGKDGDEELTDAEKADKEKQSRKEKREERRQAFLDSIKPKAKGSSREDLIKADPDHKPLDYTKADELKADELEADRKKTADNAFAKGAAVERGIQEQERFWETNENDEKLLFASPDYQFLNPDNKAEYNAKRAEVINKFYMSTIGYSEQPLFNPTTRQPLIGQDGRQVMRPTVQRTDLPYKTFVEGFVAAMDDHAEDQLQEEGKKVVTQQRKQGVRPGGGGKSRNKPQLKPGVFSSMSDEDFEKFDAESDDELLAVFG